jgi:hypothetical protein
VIRVVDIVMSSAKDYCDKALEGLNVTVQSGEILMESQRMV